MLSTPMEEPSTDWNHLPHGQDTWILWHSLHDAELRGCVSNLLDRTVELRFNVAHLVEARVGSLHSTTRPTAIASRTVSCYTAPSRRIYLLSSSVRFEGK